MPTYQYECRKCHNQFEVMQHMSDEPIRTCPTCGGDVFRVISGGGGVIYKGTGFYCTDHGMVDFEQNVKDASKTAAKKPACAACSHATAECGAA